MQLKSKFSLYGPMLVLILLIILPFVISSSYLTHIVTLILLWSFVATAWAYMARFGMVSLGHGVFLGIGAYFPTLMFNYWGVTPWIGIFVGLAVAIGVAAILGYTCFRFGLLGDYFALVTLAVAEVSALVIMALREITGGSLGYTLRSTGRLADMQFADKRVFYFMALILLSGLREPERQRTLVERGADPLVDLGAVAPEVVGHSAQQTPTGISRRRP